MVSDLNTRNPITRLRIVIEVKIARGWMAKVKKRADTVKKISDVMKKNKSAVWQIYQMRGETFPPPPRVSTSQCLLACL